MKQLMLSTVSTAFQIILALVGGIKLILISTKDVELHKEQQVA